MMAGLEYKKNHKVMTITKTVGSIKSISIWMMLAKATKTMKTPSTESVRA